jgi:hypothetical protein
MLDIPFELISCTWPRPVAQVEGRWTSEPEWDAMLMPSVPEPRWRVVEDEACWTIDWREWFKSGLGLGHTHFGGEMRGFHVVFRLRARRTGKLVFWDDDGSVIRRRGEVVHQDPDSHVPSRHEIEVTRGEELEVAQWQHHGDWLWGARVAVETASQHGSPESALAHYLGPVERRLRSPSGPPLKMYTSGLHPARAVACLYSLILNGYAPSKVLLYGDYQWSARARELFAACLPFAEVVQTERVSARLLSVGGHRLSQAALNHWYVMKALVALLLPPAEFCLIDDDIFILENMDDALEAFREHELVYIPDTDHGPEYLRRWGWIHGRTRGPLPTARFNAGLYLMRRDFDPRAVAAQALRVRARDCPPHFWEQGYLANLFALKRTFQLPAQRYFYPLLDGLPGGPIGYDYAQNPCGFASVHFGGLSVKPSDAVTLQLLPQLLERAAPPASAPAQRKATSARRLQTVELRAPRPATPDAV